MNSKYPSMPSMMLGWLNRFSGWLLFLAVLWLGWALARLLWLMLAPPHAPILPAVNRQDNTATQNHGYFVLFQNPEQQSAPQPPPPNVKLRGIMLATPEKYSSAVLDVNGQVKNYHLNDTLANSNYRLIAVNWNEVVIANDANQESILTLRQPMSLNQATLNAQVQSGQISNEPLPSFSEDSSLSTEYIDNSDNFSSASETENLNRDDDASLNTAINGLQENPANYLTQMGVRAVGDGYEVSDVMPAEMRDRLGLEVGDKVVSVNGQSVGSDFDKDANLLEQIQKSGEAQIQVQRGDQLITIRQQF